MANESTTTTLNDVISSEVIDPMGLDYVHDWTVIAQLLRPFSIVGKGTSTYQLWRFASDMGTVGDAGSGVDTEYDGTKATDLSNVALDTYQVQITASEYGVMRTLTDNVFEDSMSGIEFASLVIADCARILATAFEDDCAALLGAFTNVTGSSGTNISLANMTSCIIAIRNRGVRAPDGLAFVLDEQQASDWEEAIVAGSTSTAVYAGSADRFLGLQRNSNNGLTNGLIGEHRGYPVYMTGLTDTANTGADVEGACFVPYTPANAPMCALGQVTAREFRVEQERDASLRGTEFVATMRKGCGELYDAAGQSLVTDA